MKNCCQITQMMPSRSKSRNLKNDSWVSIQLSFRVLVTTESLEIYVQFETWGTNTDLLTILLHVHEKHGDGSRSLFDKHNLVPVKIVCNNIYDVTSCLKTALTATPRTQDHRSLHRTYTCTSPACYPLRSHQVLPGKYSAVDTTTPTSLGVGSNLQHG